MNWSKIRSTKSTSYFFILPFLFSVPSHKLFTRLPDLQVSYKYRIQGKFFSQKDLPGTYLKAAKIASGEIESGNFSF